MERNDLDDAGDHKRTGKRHRETSFPGEEVTGVVSKSSRINRRWSKEEDEILTDYIVKHGYCNCDDIPKTTGLARNGISCRNQWFHFLQPALREGRMNDEELPGRTDNDIKNYYNQYKKKKLEPADQSRTGYQIPATRGSDHPDIFAAADNTYDSRIIIPCVLNSQYPELRNRGSSSNYPVFFPRQRASYSDNVGTIRPRTSVPGFNSTGLVQSGESFMKYCEIINNLAFLQRNDSARAPHKFERSSSSHTWNVRPRKEASIASLSLPPKNISRRVITGNQMSRTGAMLGKWAVIPPGQAVGISNGFGTVNRRIHSPQWRDTVTTGFKEASYGNIYESHINSAFPGRIGLSRAVVPGPTRALEKHKGSFSSRTRNFPRGDVPLTSLLLPQRNTYSAAMAGNQLRHAFMPGHDLARGGVHGFPNNFRKINPAWSHGFNRFDSISDDNTYKSLIHCPITQSFDLPKAIDPASRAPVDASRISSLGPPSQNAVDNGTPIGKQSWPEDLLELDFSFVSDIFRDLLRDPVSMLILACQNYELLEDEFN